ncbi:MAG: ATP-grasp domain-containing protein [Planctomycetes bacterium]|nr:ATP-grasp domain-containing protein [Planctomycetota bacterium]
MNTPVVAITGIDATDNPHPGVAVARALRAAPGFRGRLVGLAFEPLATGAWAESPFDEVFLVPPPSASPEAILERLRAVHRERPLDALIPALDSEVAVYARMAHDLSRMGIGLAVAPEGSVKARNKPLLPALCERAGIPAPRTMSLTDPRSLDAAADRLGWPLVLKGPLADARMARENREARTHFHDLVGRWGYPILAQEHVRGEEFDVAALAGRGGSCLGTVSIHKLALSGKGKGCAAVTVRDPLLEGRARTVLGALRWFGPCELEFMREETSGEYVLIEVNARWPAWIHLAAACGRNLPVLGLRLALGEEVAPLPPAEPGVAFVRGSREEVHPVEELLALVARGRTGERPGSEARRPHHTRTICPAAERVTA